MKPAHVPGAVALAAALAVGCTDDTMLDVVVTSDPALRVTSVHLTAAVDPARPTVRQFPIDVGQTVHWYLYPKGDKKDLSFTIHAEGWRADEVVASMDAPARFQPGRRVPLALTLGAPVDSQPDAGASDPDGPPDDSPDGPVDMAEPADHAPASAPDAPRLDTAPADTAPTDMKSGVCGVGDRMCSMGGVPMLCTSTGVWTPQTLCTSGKQQCQNGTCVCMQATCGTDCADLTRDVHNCGGCGHDCLGGACIESVCQPVPLVASGATGGLVVVGDHLYWNEATAIQRMPISGGSHESVATTDQAGSVLVTAGGYVFWAQGGATKHPGTFRTTATAPGTIKQIASDPGDQLAASGNRLLFTSGPMGGTANTVDLDGANRTEIITIDRGFFTVTMDDQAAYLVPMGDNGFVVDRVDLKTHATIVLVTSPQLEINFALGGKGYLYVLDDTFGRVAVTGGLFMELFPKISSGLRASVVADDDWAYYAPSHEIALGWCASTIGKIRADLTGATTKLADEIKCIEQMVQDDRAIYWRTHDGAIRKVAK